MCVYTFSHPEQNLQSMCQAGKNYEQKIVDSIKTSNRKMLTFKLKTLIVYGK